MDGFLFGRKIRSLNIGCAQSSCSWYEVRTDAACWVVLCPVVHNRRARSNARIEASIDFTRLTGTGFHKVHLHGRLDLLKGRPDRLQGSRRMAMALCCLRRPCPAVHVPSGTLSGHKRGEVVERRLPVRTQGRTADRTLSQRRDPSFLLCVSFWHCASFASKRARGRCQCCAEEGKVPGTSEHWSPTKVVSQIHPLETTGSLSVVAVPAISTYWYSLAFGLMPWNNHVGTQPTHQRWLCT